MSRAIPADIWETAHAVRNAAVWASNTGVELVALALFRERERCEKIARKTEPEDADFDGVWTEYEHGVSDTQDVIARAIRGES